jgi:hypothetical protein
MKIISQAKPFRAAKEFMQKMTMACQARKYVYGVDDSQLRFVSNRFGQKAIAGPGDA